ncbi:hypothetical protein [Amycolatopsis granulosa]|uniref:hypothetical protein n=1 Tax=Amycolatopsis granulosa TaxID=185684 RepID=UPI00141F69E2|nr:hypothetical protein [Amycolatopsis granulosa]NIH88347.1 hypothetical protein [Amycolatopsis granulosa]
MPDTVLDEFEFADLVCADPDWLHEEFAAIIDAGFGDGAEPADEHPRRLPCPPPLPPPAGRPRGRARVQLWRRQRSPPGARRP